MCGVIAGLAFLVLVVGVYAGVEPEKQDMTKGMNMDNLTKKKKERAGTDACSDGRPGCGPAAAPAAARPRRPKRRLAAPRRRQEVVAARSCRLRPPALPACCAPRAPSHPSRRRHRSRSSCSERGASRCAARRDRRAR